jgi:hypothetical protein
VNKRSDPFGLIQMNDYSIIAPWQGQRNFPGKAATKIETVELKKRANLKGNIYN